MITCEDCKIIYDISEAHQAEHPNLCCDCFDQTYGMPDRSRGNPRPKDGEFVCVLRVPFPDHTKFIGRGPTREEAIRRAREAIRSHVELIRELI